MISAPPTQQNHSSRMTSELSSLFGRYEYTKMNECLDWLFVERL